MSIEKSRQKTKLDFLVRKPVIFLPFVLYVEIFISIGIRNEDFRYVKKIRAHLSSLPSISQEFAWDEYCDWRIRDYRKGFSIFQAEWHGIERHF